MYFRILKAFCRLGPVGCEGLMHKGGQLHVATDKCKQTGLTSGVKGFDHGLRLRNWCIFNGLRVLLELFG